MLLFRKFITNLVTASKSRADLSNITLFSILGFLGARVSERSIATQKVSPCTFVKTFFCELRYSTRTRFMKNERFFFQENESLWLQVHLISLMEAMSTQNSNASEK